MKYVTTIGDQEFTIDINDSDQVQIDGELLEIDFQGIPGTQHYSLIVEGHSYEVGVDDFEGLHHVVLNGITYEVQVEDERTRRLAGLGDGASAPVGEVLIKAPMPGVVVEIPVEVEQTVRKDDILVILESMKMQNEFKAPRDGVVSSIRVSTGQKVDQNAIMITIN